MGKLSQIIQDYFDNITDLETTVRKIEQTLNGGENDRRARKLLNPGRDIPAHLWDRDSCLQNFPK